MVLKNGQKASQNLTGWVISFYRVPKSRTVRLVNTPSIMTRREQVSR